MQHNNTGNIEIVEAFARLDVNCSERTGIPEGVLAEGKTHDQIVAAVQRMAEKSGVALATRVSDDCAKALQSSLGSKLRVTYNQVARTVVASRPDFEVRQRGGGG